MIEWRGGRGGAKDEEGEFSLYGDDWREVL